MDRVAATTSSVERMACFSTPGTNLKPPGLVESSVPASPSGWRRTKTDKMLWKEKGCPIPDDDGNDLRLARARELVELGHLDLAFDVLTCGSWRCNQRWCPRCGPVNLQAHRAFVRAAHGKMTTPVLAVFKVYSRKLTKASLETAYDELRRGIRAVSRCRSMRSVRMAVGKIEAVPVALGGRSVWHVHAHILLDVDGELDVKAVQGDLRRITRRKSSSFDVEPIISDAAVTAYITKVRDVCPAPGRLTLDQFDQLMGVFKHRELLISWGLGGRGRKVDARRVRLEPVSPFVPMRRASSREGIRFIF